MPIATIDQKEFCFFFEEAEERRRVVLRFGIFLIGNKEGELKLAHRTRERGRAPGWNRLRADRELKAWAGSRERGRAPGGNQLRAIEA